VTRLIAPFALLPLVRAACGDGSVDAGEADDDPAELHSLYHGDAQGDVCQSDPCEARISISVSDDGVTAFLASSTSKFSFESTGVASIAEDGSFSGQLYPGLEDDAVDRDPWGEFDGLLDEDGGEGTWSFAYSESLGGAGTWSAIPCADALAAGDVQACPE
jgi:hypothetical protein